LVRQLAFDTVDAFAQHHLDPVVALAVHQHLDGAVVVRDADGGAGFPMGNGVDTMKNTMFKKFISGYLSASE
jgi:hypothetical protein